MPENNTGCPAMATAFMEYLNCPCQYFAPMLDDDPLMEAFRSAQKRGQEEGFIPMLIAAEDNTLWECLLINSDPDSNGSAFSQKAVGEYRAQMLAAPLTDGKELINSMVDSRRVEAAEDEFDWDEIVGDMDDGECNNRFLGYWDFSTEKTMPLILAEIPVSHPWEVFAYLPFGGWNECPGTEELMATAKYWFELYGAVPAVVTHDVLEFVLPQPIEEKQAMPLALEQYAWCPDIVDQGVETVGALADALRQSTVWYFWWD